MNGEKTPPIYSDSVMETSSPVMSPTPMRTEITGYFEEYVYYISYTKQETQGKQYCISVQAEMTGRTTLQKEKATSQNHVLIFLGGQ